MYLRIFEHVGDMTFVRSLHLKSSERLRQKRNAVVDSDALWPDGVIPYEISPQFEGECLLRLITTYIHH